VSHPIANRKTRACARIFPVHFGGSYGNRHDIDSSYNELIGNNQISEDSEIIVIKEQKQIIKSHQ
jgi:hypothetical protein